MKKLEIEVKFYIPDLKSIRQRIIDMDAQCHGRFFETNLRFEDPKNSLNKNNALLRLRKDKKATLTYKSNPPGGNTDFKIFNELEFDILKNLLNLQFKDLTFDNYKAINLNAAKFLHHLQTGPSG